MEPNAQMESSSPNHESKTGNRPYRRSLRARRLRLRRRRLKQLLNAVRTDLRRYGYSAKPGPGRPYSLRRNGSPRGYTAVPMRSVSRLRKGHGQ